MAKDKWHNKSGGANSRPASQFESRGLRCYALVVESHGRHDGGAAVAHLGRWTKHDTQQRR